MYSISLKEWARKELIQMYGKVPALAEQATLIVDKAYLAERIVIFAVENGSIGKIYDRACPSAKRDIIDIIRVLNGKNFTQFIEENKKWNSVFPTRYKKALNLWLVATNKQEVSNKKKDRLRANIKKAMTQTKITQLEISKAAGISRGNLSSFLNGNNSSLSLDNCYKIGEYVLKERTP